MVATCFALTGMVACTTGTYEYVVYPLSDAKIDISDQVKSDGFFSNIFNFRIELGATMYDITAPRNNQS